MIKNVAPKVLKVFSVVLLIILSILLILDGKMASSKPSKKKIKPIAVNISLMIELNYLFLTAGEIDLPKNLKNSLSGDKTNEVSPPIRAVS